MTFAEGDDIPILPPVAYKAVKGLVQVLIPQSMLIQMLPAVHDRFSCDAQLSSQIARSVGMEEKPISEYHVKTKEVLECEQLPVEADSWYRLGKCLINASKLYDPMLLF